MLDIQNVEFSELKDNFLKYIESLDNFKEIQSKMDNSTTELLASLLAGYTSMNLFKNKMFREETYLQKARLETSIFESAYPLGYRFQRAKAPEFSFVYLGEDDRVINLGEVLGKVTIDKKTYDIVNLSKPKKIKYNDTINLKIGIKQEVLIETFFNTKNNLLIEPEILRSIDNDNILSVVNDIEIIELSTMFEDYILNNKMVNWSKTNKNAFIYINDLENNFGLNADKINFIYLETDGKLLSNDFKIEIDKSFEFREVYFQGLDEDTIDKIKMMAPFLKTTNGRAVTKEDYYYHILNSNIFDDVYLEPEQNIPAGWQLVFSKMDDFEDEKEYRLYVEGSIIKLSKYSYESMNDFIKRFYDILKSNLIVTPRIVTNPENEVELYLEQKFLEREISVTGDNIEIIKLNDFIKSQSCILNVYYVKKGDEPIRKSLTTSELLYLDNFMKRVSIVGINIVYIPGIPKITGLSFEVKLVNDKFQDEVYDFIKQVIKKYEYKMNSSLEVNKIISEITKYKSVDNGVEIYPVQYIKNITNEDIINSEKYEYLVFYGIDVNFVD